jgi:fumarylacetoacetate (FAA) hydrolase family protein
MTAHPTLPKDADRATLIGRLNLSGNAAAPSLVTIKGGEVHELDAGFLTITDILEERDPAAAVRNSKTRLVGKLDDILANTLGERSPSKPMFLAPCDLQAIKATGVTFIASLLERLIEEQTNGEADKAEEARAKIEAEIGTDLSKVVPASPQALELRRILQARGQWSPYLEVGLGPDAELFTKAQPMSSVGTGAEIGIHPQSTWNNPEPEVVLAINSRGEVVGATLGNDVNLRDFEGRSALLLGRAKDNNAACAIGPFLRLFDEHFTMDTVRAADVELVIEGPDGYRLTDTTSMKTISRDPEDIARQSTGANHPNPDGLMLFLGAMFAPTQDRDEPGRGFTHKIGDVVRISSPALGTLVNRVNHSDQAEPWTYGISALIRGLAANARLRSAAE